MGEKINKCRVLVWKPEGRRPLGRPRQRWENSISTVYERNRVEVRGLASAGSEYGVYDRLLLMQ